jgi:hypothetical protein
MINVDEISIEIDDPLALSLSNHLQTSPDPYLSSSNKHVND